MTLVPPFEEDAANLEEVRKHNEEMGDWDTAIPYSMPGFTGSLSRGLKHTQRLALRGAAIVSDILRRD